MKALIRKDLYVLRRQLWFYAVIIAIFNLSGDFSLINIIYAVLLPLSAFAYDDRCHWWELSAMMPYSVREIVLSRYALGGLGIVLCSLCGLSGQIVHALTSQVLNTTASGWNTAVLFDWKALVSEMGISACLLALSMPVYFRFDAEKSRLYRTLLIMLLAAAAGVIFSLGAIARTAGPGTDVDFLLNAMDSVWPYPLAAVVLNAVSVPLSMRAYRARMG